MTSSSPGSISACAADGEQLRGAVADGDALGLDVVARGRARRAARSSPRCSGAGRARATNVIALTTPDGRVLRPGGAREVQLVDARERGAAALVGLLAQARADLLVRELLELLVVVEQAHQPVGGGFSESAQAAAEDHPQAEQRRADHRGVGEDAADHAAALVDARRRGARAPRRGRAASAARAPPSASAGCRRTRRRCAKKMCVGQERDVRDDPQPADRDRAPEQQVDEDHQRRGCPPASTVSRRRWAALPGSGGSA